MNQSCTVHGMVPPLLLLLLCCIGATHGAGWEMEFLRLEPTALKDEPRYRVDLYAPADAGAPTVVQAIVCYSAHAIRVGDTCESPGFARQYLSTDRLTLLVAALPGMHALVDVRTSDGDRCTKALPQSGTVSGEEVKHVIGVVTSGTDAVPWYYYTIVIIACCVIGVAVLTVALGVYQGKQYPYSVSFVDAYRSNSVKNKRIAAETLGLFQPSTVLIDEED